MLALHFHWSHGELMALDHAERQRWVHHLTTLPASRDLA
ncbi:DUF6760 family protein [Actinoplanes italicus]|uniref:DUF6760 domain-containing protein n=1 Tax=Actinoplanes italicus TaxID=113567 RepID=A0A2T0K366_9ACTN|nr:DUF6760 family protein [Actinoplanes italicus]PRX17288.1 hypothetical protein CLV67_11664 [Actinoplanes italicus]